MHLYIYMFFRTRPKKCFKPAFRGLLSVLSACCLECLFYKVMLINHPNLPILGTEENQEKSSFSELAEKNLMNRVHESTCFTSWVGRKLMKHFWSPHASSNWISKKDGIKSVFWRPIWGWCSEQMPFFNKRVDILWVI